MKNKALKRKKVSFGVFELEIPKKYYPKTKNNKTKEYADKVREMMIKLHNIEIDLEFCLMNIKDYKKILDSRRKAERPINTNYEYNLIIKIRNFNDDYENYSLRVYIYRETIWNFIANFLNIKNDKFFNFLNDSKIRDLKLDKTLSLFDKNELGNIIRFRNKITHKLPEKGSKRDKAISDLIKRYENDIKIINKSLLDIIKINKNIVMILNNYKEKSCKNDNSVKK